MTLTPSEYEFNARRLKAENYDLEQKLELANERLKEAAELLRASQFFGPDAPIAYPKRDQWLKDAGMEK